MSSVYTKRRIRRDYQGCPPPLVKRPPPRLRVVASPEPREAQLRGSMHPGAPQWVHAEMIYTNGSALIPKVAPVATDPTLVIARVGVPRHHTLQVSKVGQWLVPAFAGLTPAGYGEPDGALIPGTDIVVRWFLVWSEGAQAPTGANNVTAFDGRGKWGVQDWSNTTRIASPATHPRPINLALDGPGELLFAARFDPGASIPGAFVWQIGGFVDGYIYDGHRLPHGDRLIARLSGTAGGG